MIVLRALVCVALGAAALVGLLMLGIIVAVHQRPKAGATCLITGDVCHHDDDGVDCGQCEVWRKYHRAK